MQFLLCPSELCHCQWERGEENIFAQKRMRYEWRLSQIWDKKQRCGLIRFFSCFRTWSPCLGVSSPSKAVIWSAGQQFQLGQGTACEAACFYHVSHACPFGISEPHHWEGVFGKKIKPASHQPLERGPCPGVTSSREQLIVSGGSFVRHSSG